MRVLLDPVRGSRRVLLGRPSAPMAERVRAATAAPSALVDEVAPVTAVLLGLAVGATALALAFAVVYLRWSVRDSARRLDRMRDRTLGRQEDDAARRRLRLRVERLPADGGGDADSLSPASSSARPGHLEAVETLEKEVAS